ncbi:helix-turn-helix transcriptional regulator [Actinomadura chokoriensis]|uniref:helix-turn-helix transcriptional regulator n=1 Tax=Actinomadura chokoriensis TaxID=454156 RepID=UPI0031F79D71
MPMQRHATVGEAVATRRVHLGMRQRDLATAAGVSETTIRNIEAGRIGGRPTKWPLVELALRWAPGSFETLLAGDQPREIAPPAAPSPADAPWADRLPTRILDELTEHELFDSAVLDVGDDLRVIVLAVEAGRPPAGRAGRRRRVERWERVLGRLRDSAVD